MIRILHMRFDCFIQRLNLRLKRIQRMNHKFYITNLYVTFFKKICEIIYKSNLMKKKLMDADELYEYNFKNKIFGKFRVAVESLQIKKGILIRKKILSRIFLNNLISLCVIILIQYFYYNRYLKGRRMTFIDVFI